MRLPFKILLSVFMCGLFLFPKPGMAFGIESGFGGIVSSVIPCVKGGIPSLYVGVLSFGFNLPLFYIWSPVIPIPFGPPTHIGQAILGLDTGISSCLSTTVPPVPLPGINIDVLFTHTSL